MEDREDSSVTQQAQAEPRDLNDTPGAPGPVAGVGVCVIGGGFVGLVTAAGFADFGHSVVCVEKDPERLKLLRSRGVPFYERDLADLIKKNVDLERLSFSNDLDNAIRGQKAIFIAVGTPESADGRSDLSSLEEVARSLGAALTPGQILVIKSTVPVGTAGRFRALLSQNGCGEKNPVINNPEFLREGSAVYDFFHPQRIVIGGSDPEAIETVTHIHRLGMKERAPIVITNNATAEMIKYASNAFLATKVGFVNELSSLCDQMRVNVIEVARGMGLDPRIGAEFLSPGPGWGGSCLPKDLSEYIGMAETKNLNMMIASAVREANRRHHLLVVNKIKDLVGELSGSTIGVLGLSFKADTSDMRNSPAIPIIRELLSAGARVRAYDPKSEAEAGEYLPDVELCSSGIESARDADCMVILTEWHEFQLLDWGEIGESMRTRSIVDARNLLPPELLRRYGFEYRSMGQI
ncbi:MAG: UDP-glucose dehydrogenase family protein [Candidatus Zixiibacteriota bacterium]